MRLFVCVCVCERVNLPTLRPDNLFTLISELKVTELVNIFGLGDVTDSLSLIKNNNIHIHFLPANLFTKPLRVSVRCNRRVVASIPDKQQ